MSSKSNSTALLLLIVVCILGAFSIYQFYYVPKQARTKAFQDADFQIRAANNATANLAKSVIHSWSTLTEESKRNLLNEITTVRKTLSTVDPYQFIGIDTEFAQSIIDLQQACLALVDALEKGLRSPSAFSNESYEGLLRRHTESFQACRKQWNRVATELGPN